jgi:TIR domain/PQQ enzyme repeat
MASLADLPLLSGFFSYSREDDEDSGGRLSQLRQRIQAELRGQLGRTREDFRLFQDKTAIEHGKLWEEEIKSAIAEAVFFIPIITPTVVRSKYCKFEFNAFLAREKELGRNDLVFPIIYIPVPALGDGRWREDPLLTIVGSRQYEQWQQLRQLDPTSTEFALRIEKLCTNIAKAIQRSWVSPQEREEAEARKRDEDERRQQERFQQAETRRREQEQRRLDEETRRAAKEEERRKRSEKQPQHLLGVGAPGRGRWRLIAGAMALLLLAICVGLWGIWRYQRVHLANEQTQLAEKEERQRAAAKAEQEATAKAEQEATATAEQERQAAARAEQERQAAAGAANANDELIRMSQNPKRWVMPTGNYANQRYSTLRQITAENVGKLRATWGISTGALRGHEGGPLVVGDVMYLHGPFPNPVFALDLSNDGKIIWKYEPK